MTVKCGLLKKKVMKIPKNILISLILLFAVALVASIISVAVWSSNDNKNSGLAAIASHGPGCSAMGKQIFLQGGNIADVAVTTLICVGIVSPQSCGIGGGFELTMYLKDKKIVTTLNARERAPRLSTKDMFSNGTSSTNGGMAVAVPGEIKGLWELHQKYGSLPWADLIQPNIDLCEEGVEVTEYLEDTIADNLDILSADPGLKEVFINPVTNDGYKKGDKYKNLKFAETLKVIARDGVDAMYGGGSIGRMLVEDVKAKGGILSEKDLKDYRVEWRDSVSTTIINNMTLHTMPLPSCGAMLLLMVNMLRDFNVQQNALGFHRLIEAFKIGFAHRSWYGAEETEAVKELNLKMMMKDYADIKKLLINDVRTNMDPFYYEANDKGLLEARGTAHLSILAPNGDAISITNSVNDFFGAKFRSPQTGIIPNDSMDDFSKPENIYDNVQPSPNNFPIPYNNPISSAVPSIVIDQDGNVKLIIGGAGGHRIITGTFLTLFRHLYFNQSIKEAMAAPRLHHQLVNPAELWFEESWNDSQIIKDLNEKFGHKISARPALGSLTAISTMNGINAVTDIRRSGDAEVFEV